MKPPDVIKPQPTLKGFHAWAFTRVVDVLGYSHAEGAAYIINQWIRDHSQQLKDDFDISIAHYRSLKDNIEAESERQEFEEFKRMRTEDMRAEREEYEAFKRWRKTVNTDSSAIQ